MPHEISSSAQFVSAFSFVYSRLASVQLAALRSASLRQTSDEPIGEPDPDLALGRLGGVGAVDEVVRHRERVVAADAAGRRLCGVRRADRRAAGRDRALAFEHECERRPGGDEVDELAEERLLLVLGVMGLAELATRDDKPGSPKLQAATLEARDDLADEVALDRVGLREDQRAFDCHAA